MKHWLSTARCRSSSSQWAGPVVMLKAAGANSTRAPSSAMTRHSSSNRRSKQMHSPILPHGVSNRVTSFPGDRVSDSRNRWPPSTSMSNRCIFRWRATQTPCGSKTKEVLYTRPSSSSGREPPTSHSPSSRAVRESI